MIEFTSAQIREELAQRERKDALSKTSTEDLRAEMERRRKEVNDRYVAEMDLLQAKADKGEHPQGISMAMNEARRWLDRELDALR